MKATFYENVSDERYLNKKITAKYEDIPIEVLNPSNVVRPSLRISSGLIGQSVNYLYIADLERYYYIRNWSMDNGHVTIDCECDVLMSFKNDIKKQNTIVARNEKLFNMYLEDDKIKIQNRTAIRTVRFPSGFTSRNLILGVVGNGVSSS